MIQDSLKETRELGGLLMEIERVRYRLRRGNAPKEAFLDLDRRRRAELALSKICEKRLVIGVGIAFSLVVLGIFSGAFALSLFKRSILGKSPLRPDLFFKGMGLLIEN